MQDADATCVRSSGRYQTIDGTRTLRNGTRRGFVDFRLQSARSIQPPPLKRTLNIDQSSVQHARMPRTRDLAIFVLTTITTDTPYACARDKEGREYVYGRQSARATTCLCYLSIQGRGCLPPALRCKLDPSDHLLPPSSLPKTSPSSDRIQVSNLYLLLLLTIL